MKKLAFLFIGLLALTFTSCVDDDFDTPEILVPSVDFDSNTTIADLISSYSGGLDSIGDNKIIQGVVVANDESGNIYKTLYIQDATAGIQIAIDRTSMYTEFKVGQRVYIKCQGLYLGNYGTCPQLGYIYNGAIGRIPDVMVADHIFRDSLPGAAPSPTNLKIPTITSANLNTLIQIDSVHFEEVGQTFSTTTSTTNRTIVDEQGNTLILRTSNYANFAANTLPQGRGSVVGIISVYNGDYQLYIRDLNDLKNWDSDAAFEQNLIYEPFDAAPSGWTIFSVASSKNWAFDATYTCMAISGYGADAASDDYLISPAINLNGVASPILSFRTWTKYTDAGYAQPVDVMVSSNYIGSGDPSAATWTNLTATWSPANSQAWTGSGDIDLSTYIGQTVYVAFRYRSSGTGSGTTSNWEVDEFKVKGIF